MLYYCLWPRFGHRLPTKALQTSRPWANFSSCPHVRHVIFTSPSESQGQVFLGLPFILFSLGITKECISCGACCRRANSVTTPSPVCVCESEFAATASVFSCICCLGVGKKARVIGKVTVVQLYPECPLVALGVFMTQCVTEIETGKVTISILICNKELLQQGEKKCVLCSFNFLSFFSN